MIQRFLSWLTRKSDPVRTPDFSGWMAFANADFIDAYRRQREPTPRELLRELKATAWACATINAASCASYAPRLYYTLREGQSLPKVKTRPTSEATRKAQGKTSAHVVEILDHPLLDLFQQVNPVMNSFDLWELTTLYQEVIGSAYWYLEMDDFLGTPSAIWVLPAQNVTPEREDRSQELVTSYVYRNGQIVHRFLPDEIIHFSYPDPRDPYLRGYPPLRACFEQVQLLSEFAAFKNAKFRNHAIPDALLTPDEAIGESERDRLERLWNRKLKQGGAGKVIVTESKFDLKLLQHSMGDIAALSDMKITREEVAVAFGVPIPLLSSETNLANLHAAQTLHGTLTLRPKVRRRDEKINERLVPLYDPSGRLFVWTDDPVPEDREFAMRQRNRGVELGYITYNEARQELGLPPVSWGDKQPVRSFVSEQIIETDNLDVPNKEKPEPKPNEEETSS